ncbi:amino acid adenylation domain-containing protein [Kroppenstedtia pulmonis]|uniref:Phenolphthiocerol/phthiocerol polyketide synthase subunit E n=1 Tax=Kroppenstedtia pulmonis TaxID=1380685 RepID=A0A7D4BGR3_9BACL|nr:non-ribosomal peptide synthetase/type I polyketide synthase [Kroppenstedtia pulmonis]QKG83775.1 amino acid adenylation domain-containing protein [Kroppenstedtia pulmonis]
MNTHDSEMKTDIITDDTDIAVIGMEGRFPGAENVEEFWRNLQDGVESITFFSDEELMNENVSEKILSQENYVKASPVLKKIDEFDASFFGFNPREASILDPQQRLFLECAWQVLEKAGYDPKRYKESIGVYAGAGIPTYLFSNLLPGRGLTLDTQSFDLLTNNDKDYLATRVAYKLDLKGPSVSVQTACSTSLVALHLAVQALLNYDCDMALAGGVSVRVPHRNGYFHQDGTMFSPDGHCRPFDAKAQGTIFGHGLGVVILKRLKDALEDGDHIEAVIKSSAVNNDGSWKVGFTAPSVEGQTEVITTALELAEIDPETIGAIEAHGTGTQLGDPIEVAALTRAFGTYTEKKEYCAISSVKSNIGHLDAAAGVTGLIKAILQLKHKKLVPSLHFETPNPEINFENTPFYVNTELKEWQRNDSPRRAGVSSFGIGGTNAHVILEEAPDLGSSSPSDRPWQLMVLSAMTPSALDQSTANLVEHLKRETDGSLADTAYTLQVGRQSFPYRRMLVCQDVKDAVTALDGLDPQRVFSFTASEERPVLFMFPGQGSQYPNMGLELYQTEQTFREQIDICAELLRPHLGYDIRESIYPKGKYNADEAANHLTRTSVAQPALFIIGYALAKQLEEWGIRPQSMIGHSIGEYVAACLSGVFSLEDALRLVSIRGRLMEELPSGAMLSVAMSEKDLTPLLSEKLSIAANNGPSLSVVSGPQEAIIGLERRLEEKEIACRRLHTSHAFHSMMMDPILERFTDEVRSVQLNAPQIPYISNITGTWIQEEEVTDPTYWARHLRQPVRFGEGIENIVTGSNVALLEVGPGQTLGTLTRQCLGVATEHVILPTMRPPQDHQSDTAFMLTSLGRLWLSGVEVDWPGLYRNPRRRVELPTYPFERRRFWIEPNVSTVGKWEPVEFATEAEQGEAEVAVHVDFPQIALHPRPSLPNEYVEPHDEREAAVADIWQNYLGVGPIGIHDNFFELGGHSLLAAQVLGKVGEKLGVKIPPRYLLENPTISSLIQAIDKSGLDGLEEADAALPEVVPEPEKLHEPFPLRDMQQAQWLGRLGGFNVSGVAAHVYFEIDSDHIDLQRLNEAWKKVMERHPMLRTVVHSDGYQQILEDVPVYEIKEYDLRNHSDEEVSAHLQGVRDRLSHVVRPVDQWPLFEISATRFDEQRIRLHLSFELLITDVGSIRILLRDWHRYYRGEESLLKPLEINFRDYCSAESAIAETPVYEGSLEYWRERVKTLPPAPELPMVKSPESLDKPKFAGRSKRLNKKAWESIKQGAARYGVTPSAVLLAAYSSVLATWSKNDRLSLNMTVINRMPFHPQVKDMVGEFGSFDLLEVDFSKKMPFEEFVRKVQAQIWEDLEHRYVSGVRVLRELARVQGGTSGGVMPVVFTSTIVQDTDPDDVLFNWLGDLAYVVTQTPQVWLDHAVVEIQDELELSWVAIEELFPDGLLDDLWNAYVGFLEDLAEREELWKERDYQWLPDDQLRQREEVNATQGRVPKDLLQAPFAEQAAMHPDHPALISSEGTLSYEELFRRANQLGRRLREEGVRPGMLVGVAIGKSWEQIVAVLGVLQAGGAYLAVDPDLPEERQVYLLEHGQVDVVLTCDGRPITGGWPEHVQVMAADLKGWEGAEGDPLEPVQSPDDLAYVIYTSGSTGQPKGVMISHRAALNTVLDINDRFEVGPKDAVLALSALHFDLSVYDIFGMLAAGGTIVLPEAEASRNPKRWLDLMEEHDVTIWNSVPALLEMLVEQASGEAVPPSLALRQVLLSGDWIPVYLPDRIKSLIKGVQVVSLGGATEASIWSIFYPIGEVDSKWESIPYGKPLTNQTFAVLNERMEPCPVWVPGQLYIGGLGLAKGYWRDEEKTAAHFIEHPETGERLYRTGDLGRYLPDGNIEFLGREDFQVKVRGHRIELGEIESTLVQHPQVKQAVVAAVGADRNHKQLVGYVVPKEEQSLSEEELSVSMRELLESKLPSYMIPTHFMFLEGLPLTANGKVDRQALPDPERIVRSPLDENLANDELIEEIATIVSEVLGVETVGIHDNFFEMGGDSIMAIQIINKANARGYEVTPQDLFENQTIAQIATVVRKTEDKETDLSGSIPLAPFQRRLLEHGSGEIRPIFHRVNLELPTGIDQTLAEQTLLYLMKHHDPLRLRFIREESGWVQRTAEESDSVYIPFIDLSALSDEDQQEAMQQMTAEMMEEINPSEEAPIKVAVFELGKNRDQMVWIIHRLVMDETSWKILLEDFGTVYGQLSRGDEPMLPVQRSTFKQWVERTRLYGDFVAQQESEKWLQWASEEVTLLPAGDEKADSEEGSQSIRLTLSEQDTRGLLEDVSDAYRLSLSETALAALAKTLQDWTEKHRFLVEIEQEVREELFDDLNLKRSIGCFTSVYPLMLDLEEVEETDRLLKVVKEQIRTIPSSGIGYDFLRFGDDKAIATALRSSHQPQISFRNLGDLDWRLSEPFGGSHEPVFEQGSPLKGDRPLSLTVFLSNNQLHMIWTFHSGYTRETMETLAKGYIDNLQKILDHSRLVESVAYNPTDFPHAELNQDQLDALLSSFDKGK